MPVEPKKSKKSSRHGCCPTPTGTKPSFLSKAIATSKAFISVAIKAEHEQQYSQSARAVRA